MKRRRRNLLVLLLFAGAGLGLYGYYRYNEGNPSVMDQTVAARFSAEALLDVFQKDETGATRQYADKVLAVRGSVRRIAIEPTGGYTLYLATMDIMRSISCSLDTLVYRQSPPTLHIGDSVEIRGVCTGSLLDIVMVRCVVEK